MANIDFEYPVGRAVRHLDVSPLIEALRFQPEDFELERGWLSHAPSRHRFQFDRLGRVTIEANCGCSAMAVKPEQKDELFAMFKTWRREYWVPLETNREFASHFEKPNAWGRLFRDVRMAFRRFLRREQSAGIPVEDFAQARATPAE
jgi:hypothetical protein